MSEGDPDSAYCQKKKKTCPGVLGRCRDRSRYRARMGKGERPSTLSTLFRGEGKKGRKKIASGSPILSPPELLCGADNLLLFSFATACREGGRKERGEGTLRLAPFVVGMRAASYRLWGLGEERDEIVAANARLSSPTSPSGVSIELGGKGEGERPGQSVAPAFIEGRIRFLIFSKILPCGQEGGKREEDERPKLRTIWLLGAIFA